MNSFWDEEGTADEIWDRWIVEKKYKNLLLYTKKYNDVGSYSVNSYGSLEEALLQDNEIMLFKQFWKYILGTRVQRFWKIYNHYLKSKINEPKEINYFYTVDTKVVEANKKLAPAYSNRNLDMVSDWYNVQWHIDKYIEAMQKINAREEIERAKLLKENIYNFKKPKAKKTTDKRKMSEILFWELIEESTNESENNSEFIDIIKDKLEVMGISEIKIFQKIFLEKMRELYHWDIWALAYILHSGCGDDTFDYFRASIISKGKEKFNIVKEMDVKKLKKIFESDDSQFEDFLYVAEEAYENKKFEMMPVVKVKSQEIQGKKWTEYSICTNYPMLCEIFNY